MKIFRLTILVLITGLLLTAQTVYIGQNVYYNGQGSITIAVDASLAMQRLEEDYVPFAVFLGMDPNANYVAAIPRENVVLIYNNQEYHMPALKDFRKEYRRDNFDYRIYTRFFAGVESLVLSQMRHYDFEMQDQFFPSRSSGKIAIDEGAVSSTIGFVTFAYFKNPGFKVGDSLIIKVTDKKDPNIWGATAVELK